MQAALEALASVARARRASGGRSFAVLGEMAELGPDGPAAHDGVGRSAARSGISRVVAVGEQARPIHDGAALEGSGHGGSTWVPDVGAAISLLHGELRSGDVVLVKASRAARLERVALALADDAGSGAAAAGTSGSEGGAA
jgi:UDP-N-acetylmuramoyl-tripeptide--D-alanyl-D-alanine ligase